MRSDPSDAVLFDLDGGLTPTAALHARCWKETLHPLLAECGHPAGTRQQPFDADRDYLTHVDGKQRDDGVRDFLRARGIATTYRVLQGYGLQIEHFGEQLRLTRAVPRTLPAPASRTAGEPHELPRAA